MIRAAPFFKYWLPVILWMALIFSASSDSQSSRRSSRFIEPVVRWLKPDMSEESVRKIVLVVRKCAHVTEYAVLAVLLWRARRGAATNRTGWTRAHAVFALVVASLYSASDEIHQAFVPNRGASVADVCLDTVGAALGLLIVWWFVTKRGKK